MIVEATLIFIVTIGYISMVTYLCNVEVAPQPIYVRVID